MGTTVTHGTTNTTPATNFDVAVPAHNAGDMLVLRATKNQASSASPSVSTAGWTVPIDIPNASATAHVLIAWKIGDGTESTVRLANMAGGTVTGRVSRVEGHDGTVATTTDAGSAVETAVMDVGSCSVGDAAFSAVAHANTQSNLAATNGYTVDASGTTQGIAAKVLDSTDESMKWTWTTSRSYQAGLLVVRAARNGTSTAGLAIVATIASTKAATGVARAPVAVAVTARAAKAATATTRAAVSLSLTTVARKAATGTTRAPVAVAVTARAAKAATATVAATLGAWATTVARKAATATTQGHLAASATTTATKSAVASVAASADSALGLSATTTASKTAPAATRATVAAAARSPGTKAATGTTRAAVSLSATARAAKAATGVARAAVTMSGRGLAEKATGAVVRVVVAVRAMLTARRPSAAGCLHVTATSPTMVVTATSPTMVVTATSPTMTVTTMEC